MKQSSSKTLVGKQGAISRHTELEVYQKAFVAAMEAFAGSKSFPKEETYSLTDQIRQSSRSACANITEAWRKRRYEGSLVSKLSDAEAEAAETQTWLQFAVECGYLNRETAAMLYRQYDEVLAMLVGMIRNAPLWTAPLARKPPRPSP